jgi:hypothetical protein
VEESIQLLELSFVENVFDSMSILIWMDNGNYYQERMYEMELGDNSSLNLPESCACFTGLQTRGMNQVTIDDGCIPFTPRFNAACCWRC